MEEIRNYYKIFVGTPEGKRQLRRMVILKWIQGNRVEEC